MEPPISAELYISAKAENIVTTTDLELRKAAPNAFVSKVKQKASKVLTKIRQGKGSKGTEEDKTAAVDEFNTFTCFSKLPRELQQQIWREACFDLNPRVVEYAECSAPSFAGPPCHLNFRKTKRAPFPPFMHLCRDSRAAVLNFYGRYDFNLRLANNVPEKNNKETCPTVLFDRHRDIIFLGSPYTRKLTWFQEPQPLEQLNNTSIQQCDKVVIDYKWLLTCRAKRSLLFCLLVLMEVQQVYICLESVHRRRRHKGELLLKQNEFFFVDSMKAATKTAIKTGMRQKVRDMASLYLEESMRDRYIRFPSRSPGDVEHLVTHLRWMPTPKFGFVSLSEDRADVAWDRWRSKSLAK